MDSTRPAPGPLANVDLRDPRAAPVLDQVRRRVATWGDPAIALRRATEAARLSLELICRGSMMSALGARGAGVVRLTGLPPDRPLWIVGDVRGDVLALATVLAFVDEADGHGDRAFVAFLGDWTGGVSGDAACVAMVLERLNAAPDRTLLLRGDREWLCRETDAPVASGLAAMPVPEALRDEHATLLRQVRSIAEHLPALALLPEGVALAHGSLPRPARLTGLDSVESLERRDDALRDCTLGRVHPTESRVSTASEGGVLLGTEDFAQSAAALAALVGRPVSRLVRGQDGVPEGFRWFRAHGEGAVLTVTTMSDRLEREGGSQRRRPCLARLKGGSIRVVRIEIPEEACFLCEQLFPRSAKVKETPVAGTDVRSPSERPDGVMPDHATTRGAASPRPVDARTAPDDATLAVADFDRGVRLLVARAWGGAAECFRRAAANASLRDGAMLNESLALLWMGPARHQEALARLRELLQRAPRDESVLLNLGVALLAGERNPIEACRALRSATEIAPGLADAWWALGLALAMRSDAAGAAGAFARAADAGCPLPAPGSLHGLVPARELAPALEALRAMARHRPAPGGPAVPLVAATITEQR